MWFRVDDAFLRHPKTLAAAELLGGKRPLGRVAAVWLECGLHAAGNLTDGFVPSMVIGKLLVDDRPKQVVDVLVSVGLASKEGSGIRFHDWHDYNPLAEETKEKKKRDRDRKRQPRRSSARNPDGIQADLIGESSGIREESGRNTAGNNAESPRNPERSRVRDPVPSPSPSAENIKPTAADASARSRRVA